LAATAAYALAKAYKARASSAADKTYPLRREAAEVCSFMIVAPSYLKLPNAVIKTSDATIGT